MDGWMEREGKGKGKGKGKGGYVCILRRWTNERTNERSCLSDWDGTLRLSLFCWKLQSVIYIACILHGTVLFAKGKWDELRCGIALQHT